MTRRLLVLVLAAISLPAADLFEFRSGFWINLHHFAYEQAMIAEKAKSAAEDTPWGSCVSYYRANLIKKDLLFDDGMTKIKKALSDGKLDQLAAAHSAALRACESEYRERFWPKHDADNRAFIRMMTPLLEKHGRVLAKRIGDFYGTPWPSTPVRVDLVPYATFAGAYTTGEAADPADPIHATVESAAESHQGESGLEILFHESSHGLFRPVLDLLNGEVRRQGVRLPRRDLWHAVLFYSTGEIVRRQVNPAYKPYVYRGLWERGWTSYREPIERLWTPVIDGTADRAEAMARLVKEVGLPPAEKK